MKVLLEFKTKYPNMSDKLKEELVAFVGWIVESTLRQIQEK